MSNKRGSLGPLVVTAARKKQKVDAPVCVKGGSENERKQKLETLLNVHEEKTCTTSRCQEIERALDKKLSTIVVVEHVDHSQIHLNIADPVSVIVQ